MRFTVFILWLCLISVGSIDLRWKPLVHRSKKVNTIQIVASNAAESCEPSKSLINSARLNLIGCSIVYGSNYVVSKSLLTVIPPDLLNVFRFIIPFVFFLPTIVSLKHKRRPIRIGIELGLFCAVGFIAQSIALQRASSNKVAFFISLGVLMPPLFDAIAHIYSKLFNTQSKIIQNKHDTADIPINPIIRSLYYRIVRSPFVAPILAILGASILEFTNGIDPAKFEDILLLISPVTFSLCFYRSGIHAADTANLPVSDEIKYENTKFITAMMMLTTSVLSAAYALVCNQLPLTVLDWKYLFLKITSRWQTVALLLYTGIVCTGWTAISEQKALRVLNASDIAMIYTLEPLFATLFGVLLLSEVVTTNICIGSAFIVTACLYPTFVSNVLKM